MLQFFGYYVDRFAKRNGRWAIIRRRHLLLCGSQFDEIPMEGDFALHNEIGEATPLHPEYQSLREP